jgi:hypothetical protein
MHQQSRCPVRLHPDAKAGPTDIFAGLAANLAFHDQLIDHRPRDDGHIEWRACFDCALERIRRIVADREVNPARALKHRAELAEHFLDGVSAQDFDRH